MKNKLSPRTIAWIEAGSWYGVVVILIAYMGVSFDFFKPTDLLPIFFNISGSFFMLLDAWKDRNWQPVVTNIVWIGIAVVTMFVR